MIANKAGVAVFYVHPLWLAGHKRMFLDKEIRCVEDNFGKTM
ncbi:MAG: hypothetical protein AAGC93_16930 [Cyanobacteria bacterium P01_F01_bin.53]